MLKTPRSRVARYCIAILAVTVALIIRTLVGPFIVEDSPFLMLSLTVLISAVFGGLGPAIAATLLGAFVSDFFFLPPVGTLAPPSASHGFRTVLFISQGLAISAIGAMLASAGRRVEASARQIEADREILRASEERYRAAVEQAGEGIFLFDTHSKRILEVNPALEQILGYESRELVAMTLYDLVPDFPESVDLNVGRVLEDGHLYLGERSYRRKDGSTADVEVSGNVLYLGEQRLVCAVARDISERKRSEKKLREIREAERSRIAREMHDTALQDIVFALQEIQMVPHLYEGLPRPLVGSLEESAEALRGSVESIREAIFELRLEEMTADPCASPWARWWT